MTNDHLADVLLYFRYLLQLLFIAPFDIIIIILSVESNSVIHSDSLAPNIQHVINPHFVHV